MRKTDQELMWEVFMEASNSGVITTGGPLKAGGGSSAPKSSDDEDEDDGDSYEDEEGKDKLKAVLDKCQSGDITADEAHKHITKMMRGSKPKEEDAENVKRHSVRRNTEKMRSQFTDDKSATNVRRPKVDRRVEGIGRDTTKTQGGI